MWQQAPGRLERRGQEPGSARGLDQSAGCLAWGLPVLVIVTCPERYVPAEPELFTCCGSLNLHKCPMSQVLFLVPPFYRGGT